ncbi:IS1380 family transposase [Glaciibacter superstes]|uniref:IS1380 family transposase n=1 Tax=Glaciibacter superstes TaxID=501023 RepID=UPI0003B40214|nr:IS1380 family transposase [Glaciibacter superstes]
MQLSHTSRTVSASFDDPNLVSFAGLVPVMALAQKAGLGALASRWLSVPTDKGANAGLKVTSLVAGMVAGADSIDDMALLRHGGMGKLFSSCCAPSTLGQFLRTFRFGHVRQLDAVASRFLTGLAEHTPLLGTAESHVLVDIDDTIVEVHGHQKQSSSYGYSGVKGLNVCLATVSTPDRAPVIASHRLRRGAASSSRGASKFIADTLAAVRRLHGTNTPILLRMDSAFFGHPSVSAALKAGAEVSVTARLNPSVKTAIGKISDDAWHGIEYSDAIYDEDTRRWISSAEVAEIDYTAFASKHKGHAIAGRLIVRRVPEGNPKAVTGQATLFDTYRFHAFFTNSTLDTITADKTHRAHAIIEQVNADVKNSALAHLPSGKFNANAAWLVLACIAFNLTRAAATLANGTFIKATTQTTRRKLISVPARIATSARKSRLHLPENWPWATNWSTLFTSVCGPPTKTAT